MSGRPRTGPSPVDRARPGSKHHVITDAGGTPLAITLTGGNRHDITQLLPLFDAIPRIRGVTGRPRHGPRQLFADRGYDFDKYRRLLWKRGIKPVVARSGVPHGSGLGSVRWVVERANAWIHGFRRLRIRWEIRDDIHEAFQPPGVLGEFGHLLAHGCFAGEIVGPAQRLLVGHGVEAERVEGTAGKGCRHASDPDEPTCE